MGEDRQRERGRKGGREGGREKQRSGRQPNEPNRHAIGIATKENKKRRKHNTKKKNK